MTMILPLSLSLALTLCLSASFLLYRLLLQSPAHSVKVHAHFVSFPSSCGIISACVCPFGGQSIWYFFFFIKSQSETMDLKQQMTGTLGRNQIVFSSVSLFLRWNQPIIPCAPRSTAIDVQILALCYSLLSLSLLLDASPWQQWGWSRPELVSIVEISSGKWIPRKWPFVCEERGGKKRKSRENICPTLTILFLNW